MNPDSSSAGQAKRDLGSIAVAQTCPVKGDVQANVEQHLQLGRIAAAEGADIVVFPELSLIGYEMDIARDTAFSLDDPRLSPLIEAAAGRGVTLVVGAPVRLGSRLHIGACVLRPDGTADLYTKQRLGAFSPAAACDGVVPPAESTVFDAGERNPLVRLGRATAALAICADIGRASHVQQAADRGAAAYLAGMFVIPSEFDRDAAMMQAYAARHCMVVALANFGGPSGGLRAAGRSSIWSERGDLVVRLDAAGAGVAVARRCGDGWIGKAIMVDAPPPTWPA